MTLFGSLSSDSDQIISVAVPRPLPGLFTYKIAGHLVPQVKIGGWVKVPFGKTTTHAFIVEPPRSVDQIPTGLNFENLKDVIEVGQSDFVMPNDVLSLCRWAHEYYFAPLGEVMSSAASAATFRKKVQSRNKKKDSEKLFSSETLPELTQDQSKALELLSEFSQSNKNVALLHGVTGSGKTEVYIEFAKKVLAQNKGVIILVPEIALTPQLHQRFETRLGIQVGLWHSALSAGQRYAQLESLHTGKTRVVVGARSAVFAPISNLGLIVVDEEHDPTYKQEDKFRYQARDLAIVRGKISKSFVVLGSATPSFETQERVREGRYSKVTLNQRIAPGGLPEVELVDLRSEDKVENTQIPFAKKTIDSIEKAILSGEQVIIYLNRRGFASFLLCQDCGDVKECSNCSISLTVHKKGTELRCHICGHRDKTPVFCPKCRSTELCAMGAGTETLEEELPNWIKGAKVARLDRDQVTSATRLNQILDDFRDQKYNILLGTQMLVKGHDFPGVTLVVVVMADALFRWPDFRAHERAFQVIQQVSGRAGRGSKPGRVLIQTFNPTHPVLQVIRGEDSYENFTETERQLRQALGYPPFGRLARLRFESKIREQAIFRAKAVFHHLYETLSSELAAVGQRDKILEVLGPSEAFLERSKGVYRWDILLKSKNIQILQKAMTQSRGFCAANKWQILIDVDPYSN